MKYWVLILFAGLIVLPGCEDPPGEDMGVSLTHISYNPTDYEVPAFPEFPKMEIPADNPLTNEGITLGQHLFFDPILSADNTMSCASCHFPELAFTDANAVSVGIDNVAGERSSMSLINSGFFTTGLFWDGRVMTLEEQALLPVEDPIELHHTWPEVINDLQESELYQRLFREAFGITSTSEITKELAAKAIAQFERILVSGNSKFDKVLRNQTAFTDEELNGFNMYFDVETFGFETPDAECLHCHSAPLMTSGEYLNNRLTPAETLEDFADLGRGAVTGVPFDNGRFRAPSLRNIALTAPYMHDGRFQTLREVLNHYNSGGHPSPNGNPLVYPLGLSEEQLDDLELFLHTLTDTSFYSNPYASNPFN